MKTTKITTSRIAAASSTTIEVEVRKMLNISFFVILQILEEQTVENGLNVYQRG